MENARSPSATVVRPGLGLTSRSSAQRALLIVPSLGTSGHPSSGTAAGVDVRTSSAQLAVAAAAYRRSCHRSTESAPDCRRVSEAARMVIRRWSGGAGCGRRVVCSRSSRNARRAGRRGPRSAVELLPRTAPDIARPRRRGTRLTTHFRWAPHPRCDSSFRCSPTAGSVSVGQVDQHHAVLVAAAQCELVDAQDCHLADRWIRQRPNHPQQRRPAHPHPQHGGQS